MMSTACSLRQLDVSPTGMEISSLSCPCLFQELAEMVLSERTCTGQLTSHPQSRDIQFENFSLLFHGHELIQDSTLELNYGR